jgi:hypothetical protein
MEKKKSLEEMEQEILKRAKENGVENEYLFLNTFHIYKNQLKILSDLEKSIDEDGMLVTKEYVKGRKNVYSNPAITEYNRTTQIANNTVATLLKIIRNRKDEGNNTNAEDPLFEAINGVDEDE